MAALETRDESTAEHCDDVLTLCDAIGHRLGLTGHMHKQLIAGAQLHDIGKVGVPLSILNKPGALTDTEWAVIREHTEIGERILRSVPAMEEIATIVRHSHEQWDGSGYPDGLSGEDIPLPSRVILCADAFHAMRSDRPYRRGRDAQAALAEIQACAGTQFDPRVAESLGALVDNARNGIPVKGDRLRKRRLIALLTALAIGTGGALAAAPELRDAIKSVFGIGVAPTHAAPGPLAPKDVGVGAFGELLRLPPAAWPQRVEPSGHLARSQAADRQEHSRRRTGGERERAGSPGSRRAERTSQPAPISRSQPTPTPGSQPTPTPRSQPTPTPRGDAGGRALGRGAPTPRRPDSPPSGSGGRTDPPGLGRNAGPNGGPKSRG
jgi:hypothetical protein